MIIKNLNVSKSGNQILKNLGVNFEEGKTHIIMGPNGSGKSTLFNAIVGHPDCEITSGSIIYKNEEITHKEIHDIALNNVLFPLPFGPIIIWVLPSSKLTPRFFKI